MHAKRLIDSLVQERNEHTHTHTRTPHTHTHTHTHIYIYIYIYAPPWGLSSLAKELPAAASVMQSSSKELSTLVADRV